MSATRYESLVDTLLEEGLSPAETEELAALVAARPDLRADLRRQLTLWELWSQQQAPERGADSFLAACRTRLRAENDVDRESFVAAVRRRLSLGDSRHAAGRAWFGFPLNLAWAAPLTIVLVLTVLWIALPRQAEATTFEGEAICASCMLHQTHEHLPVIRIQDGATERHFYLESDHPLYREIGDYCAAPIPIHATGPLRRENGRVILAVRALERLVPATNAPANAAGDAPVLFPF